MSDTVLITGASGFIGRHLIRKLIKSHFNIICFDLKFDTNFIAEFEIEVKMITGNLMDTVFVKNLINNSSPSYVFHLAGSKNRTNSLPEFKFSYDINYLGTLNLFEALLENQNLKLVTIMGTIEEYGGTGSPFKEDSHELPNSAYGLSKLSATKLSLIFNREFNFPVLVLRPSIAYGPGQGEEMFIPALIKTLLRGKLFKMTEGNQLRDFIFIDDLTEALIKGINGRGLEGYVLNIASGTSIKIKDIAMQIAEITGNKECLRIGEVPYRNSEIMDYTVDISKASSILQWHPQTKLCDGLNNTVSFYRKNVSDEA